MLARAEVIFQGKVQGVWFRANTQKFAVERGVLGTVRNLEDGSVEGVFEGEKNDVEGVIVDCRRKQPYAKVTGSKVLWLDPKGEFTDFRILR